MSGQKATDISQQLSFRDNNISKHIKTTVMSDQLLYQDNQYFNQPYFISHQGYQYV